MSKLPMSRSEIMRRVKHVNTSPELVVRRILTAFGIGYRLHVKTLPGSPDIVLSKYKTIIFVHGCFWHRHAGCRLASMPKSRVEFWRDKFDRNMARDEHKTSQLKELGWNVCIVWECETKMLLELAGKLKKLQRY